MRFRPAERLRLRQLYSKLMYERRLGVETSRAVDTDELGYEDARLTHYEPAEWRTLHRALPRRSVGHDDVFVDVGSGMGRMVLRAAQYPFKRVIGIELSPQLHEIAQANIERNRGRFRCPDVAVVCADAVAEGVPADATVVFLNNPFLGEVFDAFVPRILESLDRAPRRLRVVYRNPVEHDRLMATGRVRVIREWQRGAWRRRGQGVMIRTYEVLPAPGSQNAESESIPS